MGACPYEEKGRGVEGRDREIRKKKGEEGKIPQKVLG